MLIISTFIAIAVLSTTQGLMFAAWLSQYLPIGAGNIYLSGIAVWLLIDFIIGVVFLPTFNLGGKHILTFTYKRGRIVSHSDKQHRFFHGRKLDHTHFLKGGKRKRETF